MDTTNDTTPKKRLLIVDDELTAAQLLKLSLEQTGPFERMVENQSTRARAKAREFQPDLIVLDVCMPYKTGDELAAELRRDPALRNVPVIFLTSIVSGKEAGGQPMRSGGYTFLAKPVNVAKLLEVIGQLLAAPAPAR